MKTQLIRLDQFDDAVSTRDKILWSKSPRIILVFPPKCQLEFSIIDLQILYRQAQKQGSQLAFVVKDGVIKEHLDRMGILTFKTIREANQARWITARRHLRVETKRSEKEGVHFQSKVNKESKKGHGLSSLNLISFCIGMLSVFSLAAFFLPRVTIEIDPEVQLQEYEFSLQGSPAIIVGQISDGIPVQVITVSVVGVEEKVTSGHVSVPTTRAEGTLRITNLTFEAVQIPAGTVFVTLGSRPVRFSNRESVILRPGVGETTEVNVHALELGVQGNVDAGDIQAVEGALGLSIIVTNPEEINGGMDITLQSPSKSDYQMARSSLLKRLETIAEEETLSLLGEKDVLIPETVSFVESSLEQVTPQLGQPGQFLRVYLEADYRAWYIQESDISVVAKRLLDATLPEGFTVVEDEITIRYLNPPVFDHEKVEWRILSSREIERDIEFGEIFEMVAGRRLEKAGDTLRAEFKLASFPSVRIQPHWWPILPFMGFQYEVIKIR